MSETSDAILLGDDFKGDREAVADQIIRVVEDPKEVER